MPVLSVPGPGGDWFVNPDTGQAWRRGREGGIHHPITGAKDQTIDYRQTNPNFQAAAQAEINLYRQMTSPPEEHGGEGFSFEMPDFSELMKPSEEEMKLLNLQISQIEEFTRIQGEIQGRENARRDAYNRYLTGGPFTATNMEEQQGILAARSAAIAEIEQTRLKDALEGKLPVSPSTERAIREGKEILAERNIRDLGPLGATSTPGIERQAAFDESAEILKDVDRKGFIERGIRPSIDAASFAVQQIGEYIPGEIPGGATALSGLRANRQLAASIGLQAANLGLRAAGMEMSAGGGGGGNPGYGLSLTNAYQQQTNAMQNAASGGGGGFGGIGGGLGALAGGVGGALLGGAWNFGLGAPVGAAIGAGIGGSLGGAAGSSLGSGFSGGSFMPSLYGGGGGFTPSQAYGAYQQPRYGGWNTGRPAWG